MNFPKNWQFLHHTSFVLHSTPLKVWQALEENLFFMKKANPDALHLEFETFGIDEARDLSDWSYKKPFGKYKVAVVSMNHFTLEAQNALLKLFEEPPIGTYFFLIINNSGIILPTLLSRMHSLEMDYQSTEPLDNSADLFFKSDLKGRFKIINTIIKNKDREEAKRFVQNLLHLLLRVKKEKILIQNLLEAEKYLSLRSSSIKMILERLAIMC